LGDDKLPNSGRAGRLKLRAPLRGLTTAVLERRVVRGPDDRRIDERPLRARQDLNLRPLAPEADPRSGGILPKRPKTLGIQREESARCGCSIDPDYRELSRYRALLPERLAPQARPATTPHFVSP